MGASKGLTTPIGELISDLIVPITKRKGTSRESQSTEEVMRAIEEVNAKLRDSGAQDIALGSMDIKALYLSLRIKEAVKVVADEILKAEVDYIDSDMKVAGAYLATVLPKER